MLLARSTDDEKMRRILQVIRELSSLAHLSEVAQDNLYASIARSHPKALLHLEAGNTAAAMKEMAGAPGRAAHRGASWLAEMHKSFG